MGRILVSSLLFLLPVRCSSQNIWTGTSGNQQIVWSTSDLTAHPANFSFRATANRAFQAYQQGVRDAGLSGCTYEESLTLLSVVGSVVSFRDEERYTMCPGSAHPGGGYRLTAIDLSKKGDIGYAEPGEDVPSVDPDKPGLVVPLNTLFPADAILTALAADSILKPEFGDKPESLKDLAESLDGVELSVPKQPCKFTFPKDYLTRFAFHHVEAGKVAVRIALEPLAGACRAAEAQLGILLPIPQTLLEPLNRAARGTEGFLVSTAKKPSPKQKTVIRFKTNGGTR